MLPIETGDTMKHLLAAILALSVSGIAAQAEPAAIKQMILANKARIWKDAASIQDASISNEVHNCLFWSCVCIEANARNSFGGFTGIRRVAIMFNSSGQLQDAIDNGPGGYAHVCQNMRPFPELNGKGR